jgi:hypothetical protein
VTGGVTFPTALTRAFRFKFHISIIPQK